MPDFGKPIVNASLPSGLSTLFAIVLQTHLPIKLTLSATLPGLQAALFHRGQHPPTILDILMDICATESGAPGPLRPRCQFFTKIYSYPNRKDFSHCGANVKSPLDEVLCRGSVSVEPGLEGRPVRCGGDELVS